MALSGLHVECGYAGGPGLRQTDRGFSTEGPQTDISTNGSLIWSQTLAVGGQTVLPVPKPDPKLGSPILSLRSSVDVLFSVGRAPNPAGSQSRFLRGGQGIEIFPREGDFLACSAATLLAGVFISCGYAAGQGFDRNNQILLADVSWSIQMAAPGNVGPSFAVPAKSHNRGNPVISISTAANGIATVGTEIFYAFGRPGVATANPRRYLGIGEDTDLFAEPGQIFAWTTA